MTERLKNDVEGAADEGDDGELEQEQIERVIQWVIT